MCIKEEAMLYEKLGDSLSKDFNRFYFKLALRKHSKNSQLYKE